MDDIELLLSKRNDLMVLHHKSTSSSNNYGLSPPFNVSNIEDDFPINL